MIKVLTMFMVAAISLSATNGAAMIVARPLGQDGRIKIINYAPNSVFRFTGHYMFQSIIEFALDEEIDTISMGSSSAWQITPSGNRIFIKPIDDNAVTNMTVITNKRMYFFEMHAQEADGGVSDEKLSFITKFIYPDELHFNSNDLVNAKNVTLQMVDLTKPERYNFQYTVSGDAKAIEPSQVFDDGEFTYFKFGKNTKALPAIFDVDGSGNEYLVNFRIQNGYMIIEKVGMRFTLRHGFEAMCVFNEKLAPEVLTLKKKKSESRRRKNKKPAAIQDGHSIPAYVTSGTATSGPAIPGQVTSGTAMPVSATPVETINRNV